MLTYKHSDASEGKGPCRWAFLGRLDYQEAWELQRALAAERAQGGANDSLLLLEHPPTYTLGRRGQESDLLLPKGDLERRGATVFHVDRGGEVTYHGPGQLVGYPIVALGGWGGPLRYVRALEAALTGALAEFTIRAEMVEGLTGVWVGGRKIAAIGVRISRGITSHGFALNVSTDLSWFQHIVPCGIQDGKVTSLAWELGHPVPLKEVAIAVAERFGAEMGFSMNPVTAEEMLGLSQRDAVREVAGLPRQG